MSNYTTLEDKPLAEYYRKIIKHNSLRLSKFIDRIIDDFERKGWVDLEETYFSLLYEYRDEAKTFNAEMEKFREALAKFLRDVISEDTKGTMPIGEIRNHGIKIKQSLGETAKIFFDKEKRELLKYYEGDIPPHELEQAYSKAVQALSPITVLTFNYTDTCEALYKDALTVTPNDLEPPFDRKLAPEGIPPIFLHIHGSLKEDNIVLGSGDETTEKFRELEDANDNELTKYFKSFTCSHRAIVSYLAFLMTERFAFISWDTPAGYQTVYSSAVSSIIPTSTA